MILGQGATANAILGRRRVPAKAIRGFKRGAGSELAADGGYDGDEADGIMRLGAIVIGDESLEGDTTGGIAEKAGTATAIVVDRTKRTYAKVAEQTEDARRKAKDMAGETMGKASSAAGRALEKGAFVTGRQIGRATGMFSEFRDEFKRALESDEEDDRRG